MYNLITEEPAPPSLANQIVDTALETIESNKPASELTESEKFSILCMLGMQHLHKDVVFENSPTGGYEISNKKES